MSKYSDFPSQTSLRPKSAIYTLKRDFEHPCHFFLRESPRETKSDKIRRWIWFLQFNIIDKPDTILDHYSQSCLECDTYASWSQSHYHQPGLNLSRMFSTCSCVISLTSRKFSLSRVTSVSRAISVGCLEHFPAEGPVTLTEKRNIQKRRTLSCNTLTIQFHVIKINESTVSNR